MVSETFVEGERFVEDSARGVSDIPVVTFEISLAIFEASLSDIWLFLKKDPYLIEYNDLSIAAYHIVKYPNLSTFNK